MHRFTQRIIRESTDSVGLYGFTLLWAGKFIANQLNQDEFNRKERTVTGHLVEQISSLWNNFTIRSEAKVGYFNKWAKRQLAKKLIHLPIWSAVEFGQSVNVARAIELGTSVRHELEALFGPDHPETLISRHYLGVAYFNAGRIDEAIDLHRQTLVARERILGPDHPDTPTPCL